MSGGSKSFKKAMRRANRQAFLDALREGRVQRSVRFTDRKKKASREACRGDVTE